MGLLYARGMQPEIIAAWIGVIAAAAIGGAGWLFAGIANSHAKKANKLAKAANSIAARALAQAAASNKIAEDANELSQQANSLSERSALQASEESFVQWLPDWDATNAALVLTNRGRDTAHQPSVVVTGQKLHALDYGDDTPPGEQISITLTQIREKRNQVPVQRVGTVGGPQIAIARVFRFTLSIVVLWKSENGFPRQQHIEFEIREGKRERSAVIL